MGNKLYEDFSEKNSREVDSNDHIQFLSTSLSPLKYIMFIVQNRKITVSYVLDGK
jgi:hypothetical protein